MLNVQAPWTFYLLEGPHERQKPIIVAEHINTTDRLPGKRCSALQQEKHSRPSVRSSCHCLGKSLRYHKIFAKDLPIRLLHPLIGRPLEKAEVALLQPYFQPAR